MGTPAASSLDANLYVAVGAARQVGPNDIPPPLANGETIPVDSLTFVVGVLLNNRGPDDATVHVRFTLPPGLSWGADAPDPSEDCTSTASIADCRSPLLSGPGAQGWVWDVVAAQAGSYPLRAEIVSTSTPDPNTGDNVATVTVIVGPRTASPRASTVTVVPRRPRAGAVVSARSRVSLGEQPLTPTGLRCRGRIGRAAIAGTGRLGAGIATCTYRTRRTHRGKTLQGTLEFSAGGTSFTRRFSVGLR